MPRSSSRFCSFGLHAFLVGEELLEVDGELLLDLVLGEAVEDSLVVLAGQDQPHLLQLGLAFGEGGPVGLDLGLELLDVALLLGDLVIVAVVQQRQVVQFHLSRSISVSGGTCCCARALLRPPEANVAPHVRRGDDAHADHDSQRRDQEFLAHGAEPLTSIHSDHAGRHVILVGSALHYHCIRPDPHDIFCSTPRPVEPTRHCTRPPA